MYNYGYSQFLPWFQRQPATPTTQEFDPWSLVQNLAGTYSAAATDSAGASLAGSLLQGQDLENQRFALTMASLLGNLGAAIGGDSIGGRIAQNTADTAAGAMKGSNNQQLLQAQQDYMQRAMEALYGGSAATGSGGNTKTTQEKLAAPSGLATEGFSLTPVSSSVVNSPQSYMLNSLDWYHRLGLGR